MGPLYKLPFIQRRYRQRQGGSEGGEKYTEEQQGQVEEEKERGGEPVTVEEGDKWYVVVSFYLKLMMIAFCFFR